MVDVVILSVEPQKATQNRRAEAEIHASTAKVLLPARAAFGDQPLASSFRAAKNTPSPRPSAHTRPRWSYSSITIWCAAGMRACSSTMKSVWKHHARCRSAWCRPRNWPVASLLARATRRRALTHAAADACAVLPVREVREVLACGHIRHHDESLPALPPSNRRRRRDARCDARQLFFQTPPAPLASHTCAPKVGASQRRSVHPDRGIR
jgi:hypothetical protein